LKKKSTIGQKTQGRAKDELEIATNWTRVFVDLYQSIKWLNAFAIINEIALQNALH
jgi:hypothetical protein